MGKTRYLCRERGAMICKIRLLLGVSSIRICILLACLLASSVCFADFEDLMMIKGPGEFYQEEDDDAFYQFLLVLNNPNGEYLDILEAGTFMVAKPVAAHIRGLHANMVTSMLMLDSPYKIAELSRKKIGHPFALQPRGISFQNGSAPF